MALAHYRSRPHKPRAPVVIHPNPPRVEELARAREREDERRVWVGLVRWSEVGELASVGVLEGGGWLNRDVAKLEVFKKTLMQSLQEDDDNSNIAPRAKLTEASSFSSPLSIGDEDSAFRTSKSSQLSETPSSVSEENSHVEPDVPRPPRPHVYLPSFNNTPKFTPPDSPPRSYAPLSPPRRHSISIASMNRFEDRSSVFPGHRISMTSPFETASQTGRTRVDGKEFFRQVRNPLSYEQFSAFLSNVKELNAQKQTREDTLRSSPADSLF